MELFLNWNFYIGSIEFNLIEIKDFVPCYNNVEITLTITRNVYNTYVFALKVSWFQILHK